MWTRKRGRDGVHINIYKTQNWLQNIQWSYMYSLWSEASSSVLLLKTILNHFFCRAYDDSHLGFQDGRVCDYCLAFSQLYHGTNQVTFYWDDDIYFASNHEMEFNFYSVNSLNLEDNMSLYCSLPYYSYTVWFKQFCSFWENSFKFIFTQGTISNNVLWWWEYWISYQHTELNLS